MRRCLEILVPAQREKIGLRPEGVAAFTGDVSKLDLRRKRAPVDSFGLTQLVWAILGGHESAIRALLEPGCSEAEYAFGLKMAADERDAGLFRLFLKHFSSASSKMLRAGSAGMAFAQLKPFSFEDLLHRFLLEDNAEIVLLAFKHLRPSEREAFEIYKHAVDLNLPELTRHLKPFLSGNDIYNTNIFQKVLI